MREASITQRTIEAKGWSCVIKLAHDIVSFMQTSMANEGARRDVNYKFGKFGQNTIYKEHGFDCKTNVGLQSNHYVTF